MKRILIAITIITAFATVAFAQPERIGSRQWKLVQLNGTNVSDSSNAYIELNDNETRFSGNTGCNRMFGSVDVRGRRIDFSNVGTTKMACLDRAKQRTETSFVNALDRADRFQVRRNTLEFYSRNRLIMRFVAPTKHAPIDPPASIGLEDKKWKLEAIKDRNVSTVGRGAFLVFDKAKGSAGGNSSCNVFGGEYTEKGSSLMITDVIATMRACIEDDRMTIERQFLDALRVTNRYEIQGSRLLLFRNKERLLTLVGENK